MDRSIVYAKTKEFLKGRWLRILIITLVISQVFSLFTSIFSIKSFFDLIETISRDTYFLYDADEVALEILKGLGNFMTVMVPLLFVIGIIREVLSNALNIEIKNSYIEDKSIGINSTMKITKDNFWNLLGFNFLKAIIFGLIISAIVLVVFFIVMIFMSFSFRDSLDYYNYYYDYNPSSEFALNFMVGIISLVGYGGIFVTMIYMTYGLKYVPFIISENKGIDLLDAMKKSFELTKGEKLNLFLLELRYTLRVFIPLGVMIILMIPVAILQSEGLVVLVFLLCMVATLAAAIYYGPHILVSMVIYYVETNKEEDQEYREEVVREVIITEEVVDHETVITNVEEIDEVVEESEIDESTTFMDL